jgi:hypothetical protein
MPSEYSIAVSKVIRANMGILRQWKKKLVNVADYRGVSEVANAMLGRAAGEVQRGHSGNGVG